MHICHVNLARGFSGGERQTLQLIQQQIKEGYLLTVIAHPNSQFSSEIKKLKCKLVVVSHFLFSHKKRITLECDLIHVHEGKAIYWAWIQSLLYNIPYIVTRRIDNPLKDKWLANNAYRKATTLVGLSTAIVDAIKRRHPIADIYKIPSSPVVYPVNKKRVSEIKDEFKYKFIVIQAANLLKHKGHATTVKAARSLQATHTDIHFVILGDGPEKQFLEEYCADLNNVSLIGKINDIGNWFAASNLLIHPSYSEGLGSVILEAMQAGLPVIGSRAGGIPDIIDDGVSGLLVEPGNAQSLSDAIIAVYSNDLLRRRLCIGSKEKLNEFNIQHTASLYQDIYQDVINANV